MENRHLPILHKNILLSALRVSKESPSYWGEWVVKIVLIVNYLLLRSNEMKGFRRKTEKELVQYLFISKGSGVKLHNYVYVTVDRNYIRRSSSCSTHIAHRTQ